MRHVLAGGSVLLLVLLALPAYAGGDLEVGKGKTIDRLGMGTHHYGAEVGVDDLRGKVVMFALWGT